VTFRLSHRHATNLVWPAPPLTAALTGTMSRTRLTFSAEVTTFPSHGLRITRNNTTIATDTFLNASCVDTLGPAGLRNLTTGLLRKTTVRPPAVALAGTSTEVVARCGS
jgi:hypothetical protein